MNRKILIAGLLIFVMLLVPINSAYSNIDKSVKKNEVNLVYNPMLDDTWVKTYDYDKYYWESGNSVRQTSDGGYIVVAERESGGDLDYDWIFKTDGQGNLIWDKTYTNYEYTYNANSVIETNDNNYIITGRQIIWDGYANNYKIWLLKLNTDGDKFWSKTYDVMYCGTEVIQTSDGGYAIVGHCNGGICLLKTDSNGNISWVKNYGGYREYSLKQTSDGGYIIVGYKSTNPITTWLLKTDENGTLLWDKTFNGKGDAFGESVDITMDGGYIIAGYTRKIPKFEFFDLFKMDIWVLKTNSNGEKLWEKTFGKPNYFDEGYSVYATDDGGCVVAGAAGGFIYIPIVVEGKLIKLDNLGNLEWSKTWSSSANFVQQTTDGGYILTGSHLDTVFLIKTDANGNAPPLSKTKDIGIRNRVFDNSFLLSILEQFSILNLFLQRLAIL